MQSKEVKQKKWKELAFKVVIIFAIGGVFGCVYETVLCLFQRGVFESRRGVIYGPFNPVYAFGAVAIYLVLRNFKKPLSIYMAGAITGGLIEYICSFVQETFFGTTSWDYSNYFLNFQGRTSILHMASWGLLGLFFMEVLYPVIEKGIMKIRPKYQSIIGWVLVVVMTLDMLISALASIRYNARKQDIPPQNALDRYLDRYYPDTLIERVYPHAKKIPGKGIYPKKS